MQLQQTNLPAFLSQFIPFDFYHTDEFPKVHILVESDNVDGLNAITEAIETIASVPKGRTLLQQVCDKSFFGVIICVNTVFSNMALVQRSLISINLSALTEAYYLGEDGGWHGINNVAAVLAHELEHLRNIDWSKEQRMKTHQTYIMRRTMGILHNASMNLLEIALQNRMSSYDVNDVMVRFLDGEGCSIPELNAVIEAALAEIFTLYQSDFVVRAGFSEQEDQSIEVENIFHCLAGEPLRAKNYAGEVSPDNPLSSVYTQQWIMAAVGFFVLYFHGHMAITEVKKRFDINF
jgi:hypothetical protein